MTPTPQNHREALVALARRSRWRFGAELGLGKGHLFAALLAAKPELTLIGVDRGLKPDRVAALRALETQYASRARVIIGTTHEAAAQVADGSLDFVFIDAGHSAAAVTQDIRDWWPKVKRFGWVGGHDYDPAMPGVVEAVDTAFGADVKRLPHAIWWVRKTRAEVPPWPTTSR